MSCPECLIYFCVGCCLLLWNVSRTKSSSRRMRLLHFGKIRSLVIGNVFSRRPCRYLPPPLLPSPHSPGLPSPPPPPPPHFLLLPTSHISPTLPCPPYMSPLSHVLPQHTSYTVWYSLRSKGSGEIPQPGQAPPTCTFLRKRQALVHTRQERPVCDRKQRLSESRVLRMSSRS